MPKAATDRDDVRLLSGASTGQTHASHSHKDRSYDSRGAEETFHPFLGHSSGTSEEIIKDASAGPTVSDNAGGVSFDLRDFLAFLPTAHPSSRKKNPSSCHPKKSERGYEIHHSAITKIQYVGMHENTRTYDDDRSRMQDDARFGMYNDCRSQDIFPLLSPALDSFKLQRHPRESANKMHTTTQL